MPNEAVRTEAVATPGGFYSQAVRNGDWLFISGQLPLDAGGAVVPGGAAEQTVRALENVHAILGAAGGKLADLAMVTIYVSGVGLWPEVNAAYKSFLESVPVPPARAIVPTGELHYGAKVEIQAVACLR